MTRLTNGAAAAALLGALAVTPTHGAGLELDADRFYAGGGLSHNEIGSDDALGYQGFAGYRFKRRFGDARPALEVGYWDSGDMEIDTGNGDRDVSATGLWATGVIEVPVSNRLSLFGRAGVDFGDDDGLMGGGGLGYRASESVSLRGEVVIRGDTDSLQANAVYWF